MIRVKVRRVSRPRPVVLWSMAGQEPGCWWNVYSTDSGIWFGMVEAATEEAALWEANRRWEFAVGKLRAQFGYQL